MTPVPCANVRKGGEFCGSCWYCLERLRKTERRLSETAPSPKGCDMASHGSLMPRRERHPAAPPGSSRRGLGGVDDLEFPVYRMRMALKGDWLTWLTGVKPEAKKRKGKR